MSDLVSQSASCTWFLSKERQGGGVSGRDSRRVRRTWEIFLARNRAKVRGDILNRTDWGVELTADHPRG